jgi:hypothetical protein
MGIKRAGPVTDPALEGVPQPTDCVTSVVMPHNALGLSIAAPVAYGAGQVSGAGGCATGTRGRFPVAVSLSPASTLAGCGQ